MLFEIWLFISVLFFRQGSVVVDFELIYEEISYMDLLVLEEALYVDSSFDGLDVNVISVNSSNGKLISSTFFSKLHTAFVERITYIGTSFLPKKKTLVPLSTLLIFSP